MPYRGEGRKFLPNLFQYNLVEIIINTLLHIYVYYSPINVSEYCMVKGFIYRDRIQIFFEIITVKMAIYLKPDLPKDLK